MTAATLIDGLIGALVGAVIVSVVTLAGHYLTWNSMVGAAHDQAMQISLDLDRLFVEHPVLVDYVYRDTGLPEEPVLEHDRAQAAVELVADTLEGILDKVKKRRGLNMYSETDRVSWTRYAQDVVNESAPIRDFLKDNKGWYPSIEKRLVLPDSSEPDTSE